METSLFIIELLAINIFLLSTYLYGDKIFKAPDEFLKLIVLSPYYYGDKIFYVE